VIQEKVDFELIKYLARDNRDKSIVLVGPVWNEQDKIKAELEAEKNIHFLGYKKYADAPMYIQQFDIGLIPHKVAGFNASTNPMKMYEYLACGKPVVATKNIGTENIQDMITTAKNYEEFSRSVKELLAADSSKQQAERREFVKKFSWHHTVSKMLELISAKLN